MNEPLFWWGLSIEKETGETQSVWSFPGGNTDAEDVPTTTSTTAVPTTIPPFTGTTTTALPISTTTTTPTPGTIGPVAWDVVGVIWNPVIRGVIEW